VSDFDYEFHMSSMNNKLNIDIQNIFLTPSDKFSCISSTLVMAVAIHNYNLFDEFVPECVFREI
ncbi:phosphopantetheine adenylyltransferase, partial [Francisella tularensis subsp. holarctica]|nr:phosphopantetheine adenylyltransferase [Francisella tularensis subsp. holarctica]